MCLAISGGECYISSDLVNPLGLPIRPGVQEMPLDNIRTDNIALSNLLSSKAPSNSMKNSSGYYLNRIRREQNYVIGAETYVKDDGKHVEIVKMVFYISAIKNVYFFFFKFNFCVLQNCLVGNAKCIKFRCLINNLQNNQEATISIKAR